MTLPVMAWSQPIKKQTIPQSKSRELTQQETSNQQNPPTQFVTPQQMIDALTRAIEASNDKSKTTQNPPPPDNSSWWFSLFLVIFTCGLVIVGGIQCYIIFKTLKATQVVAKAAQDSAEVAVDALHVAERAYLKFDKFELVNFSIGQHINVTYEFHNVGHTPAQIIESLTIVEIVEKDSFSKAPNYDIERGISGPKQTFIQPNEPGTMIGISKNVVTIDDFNAVTNNNRLVFVWGKITFSDAFGKIWVNGFGTVFSKTFGITSMDGYNYTKEYEQEKEQS